MLRSICFWRVLMTARNASTVGEDESCTIHASKMVKSQSAVDNPYMKSLKGRAPVLRPNWQEPLAASLLLTLGMVVVQPVLAAEGEAESRPEARIEASPESVNTQLQSASIPVYPGILPPQTAVALAIARHPEIRGAEAVIARRQADVALAESARWPTIQYGVGPGYGGSYGGGGNVSAIRGNVGINVPVWDYGANTKRIEAAKDLEEAAHQTKTDTAEKVAANTLQAYIDAAVAQERMTAAQEAIKAMRNVAQRINQRAKAGLSNRSDVNAAGIAVARAGVDAEQARTAAEAAMSRLIQLIGVSPERLMPLEDNRSMVERRESGEPDFETTPAIQAANRALEAAAAKVNVAEAERYPGIGFGASRTFSTGPYSANDSTWVGITLSGTFSMGGAEKQKIQAAIADREAARQDLEAKRLEARTSWLVAAREEQGANQRLGDLKGVSSLWLTTRDLYWQEYILDKRSLSDVINAEREIFTARADQIAATGDATSAAVRALVAQGGLVALLERQPVRQEPASDASARLEGSTAPGSTIPTTRWIEYGFFAQDQQARRTWESIKGNPALAETKPMYDSSAAGVRLLIGPFQNRAAASAACAALGPSSSGCPMIPPGPNGTIQ
jgi:adhesin transport system outer membrane protein